MALLDPGEWSVQQKRQIVDSYYGALVAQADFEWSTTLLQKNRTLQQLLHAAAERDHLSATSEQDFRDRLISDELRWSTEATKAERNRRAHVEVLAKQLGKFTAAQTLSLCPAPYAENHIAEAALAQALEGPGRDLARAAAELRRHKNSMSKSGWSLEPSGLGFTLATPSTSRSDYAQALRRHDEAEQRIEVIKEKVNSEIRNAISERDHIDADLVAVARRAPAAIVLSAEKQRCMGQNTEECSFDGALAAYKEVVALKETWISLIDRAAELEEKMWLVLLTDQQSMEVQSCGPGSLMSRRARSK